MALRTPVLASLLATVAASCSTPHAFRLEDVGTLAVGRSTRSEVERALGSPSATLESAALYESHGSEVSPPAPLSFFTWPVYFARTSESLAVLARFDGEGRLAEASLTLAGFYSGFLFLVIQPHGPTSFEGPEDRDVLARIERQGFTVWLRQGYGRVLVPYDPTEAEIGRD